MPQIQPYADLKIHPAANLFPMMQPAELEKLKADIEKHGQSEPIVFYDEQLIDGRNRYRACEQLGVEPECTDLDIEEVADPVAWVLSINLHRRHLKPRQLAMIAARLANLPNGVNKGASKDAASIPDAAKLLGVGEASVDRAKHVLKNGCDSLVAAVDAGEIALTLADSLCKACGNKSEQSELVAGGKQAIKSFLQPQQKQDDLEDCKSEEQFEMLHIFKHCNDRLDSLRLIVNELTKTERSVLTEWLQLDPAP